MAAAYEKQHKAYEALHRSVASLAESLERQLPDLPETTTRVAADGRVSLVTRQVFLTPPQANITNISQHCKNNALS